MQSPSLFSFQQVPVGCRLRILVQSYWLMGVSTMSRSQRHWQTFITSMPLGKQDRIRFWTCCIALVKKANSSTGLPPQGSNHNTNTQHTSLPSRDYRSPLGPSLSGLRRRRRSWGSASGPLAGIYLKECRGRSLTFSLTARVQRGKVQCFSNNKWCELLATSRPCWTKRSGCWRQGTMGDPRPCICWMYYQWWRGGGV